MIVPSFLGAKSAEQPQSTILQFRLTQDGNVEHPAEAWPHQVEEIHLQGILEMARSVDAILQLLQGQVQLLGFKGSNCLGAAGVCHRRVLLAVGSSELQQDSSCSCSLISQGLDWQAQRCWGLISHLAVLVCQLSFAPTWLEYFSCGAQFISMASNCTGVTDAGGSRLSAL